MKKEFIRINETESIRYEIIKWYELTQGIQHYAKLFTTEGSFETFGFDTREELNKWLKKNELD